MYNKKEQAKIPFFSYDTVIVGTGAAGYAAADALRSLGRTDFAILTEGRMMGTSRNTGSDKQTYYKLTIAGDEPDSVLDMAKTYFACGSMHGDIALTQAVGSLRAFYHLVEAGVPFPQNEFGEYVGYKTDHDPRMRATSCGPLTSKYMTEALEKRALSSGTPLYDGARVVRIFKKGDRVCGLLALSPALISEDNPIGAALFAAGHIVWATGGPAALYAASVYPESQTCAHGMAFEAGAVGINLTESQYGIASTSFRWNLSGTYQQVIPRYISTDADGNDEKEFLDSCFSSPTALLGAIFRKGYEWPFDPRKLGNGGSSTVDMAIFRERQKGRRVFLDFTKNPGVADQSGAFDFSLLPEDALSYLQKSSALLPTPIERLRRMNPRAIELYASHGIDLSRERLEIDVCAQHNNGGLDADVWSESPTLAGFFPIGECAGTFGVTRPGGSALNATQVG
ncbi:MAG: FAD-binding protein, partial [Ruminococcus sp.]|nr:FAD-binding protein [Candidatus Apopatosoma intestinale]